MKVRNMIQNGRCTALHVATVFLVSALLAVGCFLPLGCKEHELSGRDLQNLKTQEVTKRQGTLTAEEDMQILSIQARTQKEFDQKVSAVLARKKK